MTTDELITALEVQVKAIERAAKLINQGRLGGGMARLTLARNSIALLVNELRQETA